MLLTGTTGLTNWSSKNLFITLVRGSSRDTSFLTILVESSGFLSAQKDSREEGGMKYKNTTIAFGVVLMTLLAVHSVNAAVTAYTRGGWLAARYILDVGKIKSLHRDRVAKARMIKEGRFIVLHENVKVYCRVPEWANDGEVEIRFYGETESYWTYREAVIMESEKAPEWKSGPVSVHEWFILKSFLWIKPHKTTRQEIVRRYGDPTSQDEDSILYNATRILDFSEWKTIKFIVNTSGVVEGIRAEK